MNQQFVDKLSKFFEHVLSTEADSEPVLVISASEDFWRDNPDECTFLGRGPFNVSNQMTFQMSGMEDTMLSLEGLYETLEHILKEDNFIIHFVSSTESADALRVMHQENTAPKDMLGRILQVRESLPLYSFLYPDDEGGEMDDDEGEQSAEGQVSSALSTDPSQVVENASPAGSKGFRKDTEEPIIPDSSAVINRTDTEAADKITKEEEITGPSGIEDLPDDDSTTGSPLTSPSQPSGVSGLGEDSVHQKSQHKHKRSRSVSPATINNPGGPTERNIGPKVPIHLPSGANPPQPQQQTTSVTNPPQQSGVETKAPPTAPGQEDPSVVIFRDKDGVSHAVPRVIVEKQLYMAEQLQAAQQELVRLQRAAAQARPPHHKPEEATVAQQLPTQQQTAVNGVGVGQEEQKNAVGAPNPPAAEGNGMFNIMGHRVPTSVVLLGGTIALGAGLLGLYYWTRNENPSPAPATFHPPPASVAPNTPGQLSLNNPSAGLSAKK